MPSSLRVEDPKNELQTVEYERGHLQEPCIALVEEKEFRSPSLPVKIYALTFIPRLLNINRDFEEFGGMI